MDPGDGVDNNFLIQEGVTPIRIGTDIAHGYQSGTGPDAAGGASYRA